jgi:hypothetical protein
MSVKIDLVVGLNGCVIDKNKHDSCGRLRHQSVTKLDSNHKGS